MSDRSGSSFALRLNTAASDEDVLSALLWGAGCRGVETRDTAGTGSVLVTGYFETREQAEYASGAVSHLARAEPEIAAIEERDWLSEHRKWAEPTRCGRFFLDPGDPEVTGSERSQIAADEGLLYLSVPAQRAFGTGSHPTTRLVLLLMQRWSRCPLRVLDVGTGTGVLSLAAARLGARQIVALEVDLLALSLARRNLARNGLAEATARLLLSRVDALAPSHDVSYDAVFVNVLPENLGPVESIVAGLARRPLGRVVVSGVPRDRESSVLERWLECGLVETARETLDDWIAFDLRWPA